MTHADLAPPNVDTVAAGLRRDIRRENAFFLSLSLPALVLVGLCAMLPILWILRQSFLSLRGSYTLANWENLLTSDLTWRAIWSTVELSAGTLALCFILDLPLALALASAPQKLANRLLILLMLPLWTSILVRTYGWLVLLRRDGLVNQGLQGIGLTDEPLALVYNFTGTLIGMVHFMLPLFVLPTYAALRDIDHNTIRASASMGASLPRTLVSVVLPLAAGGIRSGATICLHLHARVLHHAGHPGRRAGEPDRDPDRAHALHLPELGRRVSAWHPAVASRCPHCRDALVPASSAVPQGASPCLSPLTTVGSRSSCGSLPP